LSAPYTGLISVLAAFVRDLVLETKQTTVRMRSRSRTPDREMKPMSSAPLLLALVTGVVVVVGSSEGFAVEVGVVVVVVVVVLDVKTVVDVVVVATVWLSTHVGG